MLSFVTSPGTLRRVLGWPGLLLFALVGGASNAGAQRQTDTYGAEQSAPGAIALHPRVQLIVAGNSRFAVEMTGKDSVRQHLAALQLEVSRQGNCEGPFAVPSDDRGSETAWLTNAQLPHTSTTVPTLVLVRTDSTGAVVTLTVLFDNDEQLARRFPRDDGVLRTSLTEKRNREAVRRLHGESAARRVLTARRERVFVTVSSSSQGGTGRRLVAYTFDASGVVRSIAASPPLGSTMLDMIR